MPNCELSRIRTGDLDSLPLQDHQPPTPLSFTTSGQVWQPITMMPSYGTTIIRSAVAFEQPCPGMIDAHADARSAWDFLSNISSPHEVATQTQSRLLLALVGDSNGELAETEATAEVDPSCGSGRCRPCYDHIRGKCANGAACNYCHAAIHAIRRKQRKHQRRAQAFQHKVVDGVEALNPWMKTVCCNGAHHGKCQPCFRHMRGTCALGAECAYCHDPVHGIMHRQRRLA